MKQCQALAEQRRVFDMDGGVEVLRLLTRRVQADPVHPLARDPGPPSDLIGTKVQASSLVNLTDPNALTGMSAAEKAAVANFVIP